jgi:anti-sigma factor RsiW
MRCKRICRELLWLARFGEFGPSSAPHLDHLAGCSHCRDEVGFDRALVQQLRTALAQRIEQAAPSAGAWGVILERAQAPERGIRTYLHGQAGALAARLRTATAISAMALAGIIATSTHVAITHPQAGSAETEVLTNSVGELFEC